jgi:hypothetical protein
MNRTVVRLFLLIVYVILSFHVALSFIRSDGLCAVRDIVFLGKSSG